MRVSHFLAYRFSERSLNFDKSKNYYKILNIQATSSKAVIRNAYLNLAKKYHPDINSNGKEKFTLIQQAYQVLSDQKHRKEYETFFREQFSSHQEHHKKNNQTYHNWDSPYGDNEHRHYKYHQSSEFKGHRSNQNYQQYNWQSQFQNLQKNRKQWSEQFYENEKKYRKEEPRHQNLKRQSLKKVIFENTQQGLLQRLWNKFIK